jgi:alkanesulfonate monooxygenase SsuD/methylene tetrahydromethanopterin reductase-like flavin-dependent oxidoreductase (luciferase family)
VASDVPAERLPIGITLGTVGVDAAWWLDAAERLDAAGYRAIWAWDHLMGRGDPTVPVLEAWTMLAAAASRTRTAFLGTFVDNVMNREPAVVARMASTLQAVSRGRFRLGIAIGGHPREHEAYGIPFPPPPERAEHLREAIAVIRALWSGGPVSFSGEHYRLIDAYAFPRPEPVPPVLVGAQSPAGIRIAAALGDGWAAESPSFEDLEPSYREALAAAGRERASQLVVVGLGGGRTGRAPLDPGWVDDPRGTLAPWLARGVDELNLTVRTEADVAALVEAATRW